MVLEYLPFLKRFFGIFLIPEGILNEFFGGGLHREPILGRTLLLSANFGASISALNRLLACIFDSTESNFINFFEIRFQQPYQEPGR